MTATNIAAQVTATLIELGDTPDDVADRLRALGIKGRQGFLTCCPIANLLRTVDGVETADVSGPEIHLNFQSEDGVLLRAPQPVRAFIRRFDEGVYLDLVEVPA